MTLREESAEHSFNAHSPHRLRDVGRLIELEANLDVLRQRVLHLLHVSLHAIDHMQRRSVGPLGDQHVHGPLPIHQGVAGGNVRGWILDFADVAEADAVPRPNRNIAKLLRIGRHGVHSDDRELIADRNVARRADHVAIVESGNQFLKRHFFRVHQGGVHLEDDGALAAAERRRRGNALQIREDRPHIEERHPLHLADRAGLILR